MSKLIKIDKALQPDKVDPIIEEATKTICRGAATVYEATIAQARSQTGLSRKKAIAAGASLFNEQSSGAAASEFVHPTLLDITKSK